MWVESASEVNRTTLRVNKELIAAGLLIISLLTFVSALKFSFVFDDHSQIVANPQIQSWRFVSTLFASDVWSQKTVGHGGIYYRPLFMVWLLFVHSICGVREWAWHLSSIFLHGVATLLVFRLSLVLLDNLASAAVAGLLFALHPIHVEAVSWVSAANELLYVVFFLSSFGYFIKVSGSNSLKSKAMWVSVLLWTCALFSKETALALLRVFPAWAYINSDSDVSANRKLVGILKKSWAFFVVALLYICVRSFVLHRLGTELGRRSWKDVFLSSIELIRFYITKLIFPLHLSPFYDNAIATSPSARLGATALLLVALAAVVIWLSSRYERLVSMAFLLIVLPLLPVLAGIRVFRDGDLAHDRYLYLPSVGLCLLVALLFRRIWEKSNHWLIGSLIGLMLAALLAVNVTQQRYYRDDEAFYRRGLEVAPGNALAAGLLFTYYAHQGKLDLGLQQFRRAYAMAPENEEMKFQFAHALFESGRFEEAEPLLAKLVVDPKTTPSHLVTLNLALGQTQIHLGKFSAAEATLQPLLTSNDSLHGLHRTFGTLYELQGRVYDASHEFEREYQVSGDIQSHNRAIFLATRH